MDAHQNAKTTPHGRRLMVRRLAEGWTVAAVVRRRRHAREDPDGATQRAVAFLPAPADRKKAGRSTCRPRCVCARRIAERLGTVRRQQLPAALA